MSIYAPGFTTVSHRPLKHTPPLPETAEVARSTIMVRFSSLKIRNIGKLWSKDASWADEEAGAGNGDHQKRSETFLEEDTSLCDTDSCADSDGGSGVAPPREIADGWGWKTTSLEGSGIEYPSHFEPHASEEDIWVVPTPLKPWKKSYMMRHPTRVLRMAFRKMTDKERHAILQYWKER
jgi:hypothetical protein